jgi:hypothetical protein
LDIQPPLFAIFARRLNCKTFLEPAPNPDSFDKENHRQNTEAKRKPRRTRNVQLVVRATQEEKDFIMEKMKSSGSGNFNIYALKMRMIGEVKNVDLTHYHELAKEVNKVGVNINQIARIANTSGNISAGEIEKLQERMSDIWQLLKSSLSEVRSTSR